MTTRSLYIHVHIYWVNESGLHLPLGADVLLAQVYLHMMDKCISIFTWSALFEF